MEPHVTTRGSSSSCVLPVVLSHVARLAFGLQACPDASLFLWSCWRIHYCIRCWQLPDMFPELLTLELLRVQLHGARRTSQAGRTLPFRLRRSLHAPHRDLLWPLRNVLGLPIHPKLPDVIILLQLTLASHFHTRTTTSLRVRCARASPAFTAALVVKPYAWPDRPAPRQWSRAAPAHHLPPLQGWRLRSCKVCAWPCAPAPSSPPWRSRGRSRRPPSRSTPRRPCARPCWSTALRQEQNRAPLP
mmetsp:Transcript_76572/g.215358  ORF Transcript_76572/g.215358 Transcript_76572/m.215358 type:complete len:245 (+) Transcript_76572:110-844(+)